MALDQNDPNSGSPGFLGGLLGLFKPPDVQAMYGGLLSDPATQSAFRQRGLDAMAGAFGEGAMPVPFKGGIPIGATLGKAAAAADTGMDSLNDARLKSAQQTLALANAGNAQAQTLLLRGVIEGFQNRPTGAPGAGAGTGTGGASTAGGGLSGPAKLLASQGGQGKVSPQQLYSYLLDNGASKNEATAITSGMMAESGGNPNLEHDKEILAQRGLPPGYGLFGDNGTNLTKMREFAGVGPNDPVPWQQQAIFALQSLRPGGIEATAGSGIRGATTPEELTQAQLNWLRPANYKAGPQQATWGQRLASTTAIYGTPPYAPTQTAAVPGGAPSDPEPRLSDFSLPGKPITPEMQQHFDATHAAWQARNAGGAPQVATAPAQPPAGLLGRADSAAPLPLAPTPGAPPGPQSLLGPQPGGGEVGSPLGPAGPQVAGGPMPGGPQFAGPGAADMPSAAPPGGVLPHTGAAGAAELQGLLNQPPPTPPAGGPGGAPTPPAAVPPPAAPQAAPAPPGAPGGAPMPPPMPAPMSPPPLPPNLDRHVSNEEIAWAQKQAALMTAARLPVPPDVAAIATLPTDLAKEAQKQALDFTYKQQLAGYQAQLDAWKERQKPYDTRENAIHTDPASGQITGNYNGLGPDGRVHHYYLPPGGQPRDLGPVGPSAQETATGSAVGKGIGEATPIPPQAPAGSLPGTPPQGQAAPGQPPGPVYQGTQLAPGMMSKQPDYQEPAYTSTQLAENTKRWGEQNREMAASIGTAQMAEQRLMNIATAFQQVGSKQFTSDKAAWNNALDGIFGKDGGPQWLRTSTDAGAVYTALHEAQRATLSGLKAANPRFANAEFQSLSKMSENPDLPASANLNMLSEDIGQLRQQRALATDWTEARIAGKQDPEIFEAKWLKQNQLAPIVEGVKKEIGIGQLSPGQGPAIPMDLPQGSKFIGTQGGKPVYELPGGLRVVK